MLEVIGIDLTIGDKHFEGQFSPVDSDMTFGGCVCDVGDKSSLYGIQGVWSNRTLLVSIGDDVETVCEGSSKSAKNMESAHIYLFENSESTEGEENQLNGRDVSFSQVVSAMRVSPQGYDPLELISLPDNAVARLSRVSQQGDDAVVKEEAPQMPEVKPGSDDVQVQDDQSVVPVQPPVPEENPVEEDDQDTAVDMVPDVKVEGQVVEVVEQRQQDDAPSGSPINDIAAKDSEVVVVEATQESAVVVSGSGVVVEEVEEEARGSVIEVSSDEPDGEGSNGGGDAPLLHADEEEVEASQVTAAETV